MTRRGGQRKRARREEDATGQDSAEDDAGDDRIEGHPDDRLEHGLLILGAIEELAQPVELAVVDGFGFQQVEDEFAR